MSLGDVAVAQGKKDLAGEIVKELKADPPPVVEAASRIAQLESFLGDDRNIDTEITALQRRAVQPGNIEDQQSALIELYLLYLGAGRLDKAKEISHVTPPHFSYIVIGDLADGAARAGRLERAKALAEFIPIPQERAEALQSIFDENAAHHTRTPAEIDQEIRQLPTAYDRAWAFLRQAEKQTESP